MRTYTQKGKEHVTQPKTTYEEKYRNHFQLIDVIEETTWVTIYFQKFIVTLNRKTTFKAFNNGESQLHNSQDTSNMMTR